MKNRKNRRIGYRQIFMIIFTLFWVIYPLIARVLIKQVPDSERTFFSTNRGYIIDLLLYSKEVALAFFTGACVLYFLGERIFPDNPEKISKDRFVWLKYPSIFVGGYILFSVLSFLFSNYKETAFFGVNSEYEGLLAVLCYGLIFLLSLFFLKETEKKDKKVPLIEIFKYGIIVLCIIIGILGIIEIFVRPILEFPFIQDLISSEANREIAHSIRNENFIGQICLTFHNPGFLGGFCAMIIPVCFVLSLEGKKVRSIVCSISVGTLLLAVRWSASKVAMVTLLISMSALVVLLIIGVKKDRISVIAGNTIEAKRKKKIIKKICLNLSIAVVTGALLILSSEIFPTYASRYNDEKALETGTDEKGAFLGSVEKTSKYKLTKAEIIDGVLMLYSGDKLLTISVDKEKYSEEFKNGDGTAYDKCLICSDGTNIITDRVPAVLAATSIRGEKNGFGFSDERYAAVKIAAEGRLLYLDFGYSGTVEFYITENGLKLIGQGSSLIDEIPQPRVTGLEWIYSFGTGRGYIWAQSLPLVLESLLIGGGNGTFAFRFRQNEIVGLLNTHGSCKYVIDRPHNWYLQIALSDGVPALICVVALFLWYILKFFHRFLRNPLTSMDIESKTGNSKVEFFDIGLLLGLVGFMLCGMINDSCITVNPWFWLLLGCAVTRLVNDTKLQAVSKK